MHSQPYWNNYFNSGRYFNSGCNNALFLQWFIVYCTLSVYVYMWLKELLHICSIHLIFVLQILENYLIQQKKILIPYLILHKTMMKINTRGDQPWNGFQSGWSKLIIFVRTLIFKNLSEFIHCLGGLGHLAKFTRMRMIQN